MSFAPEEARSGGVVAGEASRPLVSKAKKKKKGKGKGTAPPPEEDLPGAKFSGVRAYTNVFLDKQPILTEKWPF